MGKAATEQEKLRQAKARLRRIQHYEQVTHNVSQTCRFFGVSRRQFYTWLHRIARRASRGSRTSCRARGGPTSRVGPRILRGLYLALQALFGSLKPASRFGDVRISDRLRPHNPKVVGSNPIRATAEIKLIKMKRLSPAYSGWMLRSMHA
jgi:hypothetical protein